MHGKITEYDAIRRDARRLRARAMAAFWRRLVDTLSPRVPKLFPAEF
jgi:hypothetical protein